MVQIGGPQKTAGQVLLAVPFQNHQKRQIREGFGIIDKIRHLTIEIKFFQNHIRHGHGQGPIGAGFGRQPGIGEFYIFRVVRRHGRHLGSPVTGFGVKVGIGAAGHGQIGAPDDHVACIVPIRTFGHIGLLAPNLGGGRRQIAIPVVKTDHGGTDQRKKAGTGGIADHGHGRDRCEAEDAVRAILFDGVNQGGCDQRCSFIPIRPHEPALPSLALEDFQPYRVFRNTPPGCHGIGMLCQGSPPQAQQGRANVGIAGPDRAVGIPGIGGSPGTAPGFMIRHFRPTSRIVGALRVPDDDAVFDIHVP